ncbi:MAG: hypothetical protein C4582_04075 [Desulfobacteraceae bacterium]|nr:MAG: hypothetical protein C4582_04075 [Desulfobacteraceae bacterium]
MGLIILALEMQRQRTGITETAITSRPKARCIPEAGCGFTKHRTMIGSISQFGLDPVMAGDQVIAMEAVRDTEGAKVGVDKNKK